MISQSPNTFHIRTKQPVQQPTNQYRPSTDSSLPRGVQEFQRQTLDLVNNIQSTQTPTSLFVTGNQTGDPLLVLASNPTVASGLLGTSLGLNLEFGRSGTWIVRCSVCLQTIGDAGQVFSVSLVVGASPQGNPGQYSPSADGTIQVHQSWQVTAGPGLNSFARLYIVKDGGGGTSQVLQPNTTLEATWQGA